MSIRLCNGWRTERGVGLMEVMISIVIGMLLVLVIYQVYEISESQKRTITAGSDAQQNASYGAFVIGRDISMAGNGIASAAVSLDTCPLLRSIPVLINAGAGPNDPDTITVLYGGSSSLSTALGIKNSVPSIADPYNVQAPIGFSVGDVIVATQATPAPHCTLSTVNAVSAPDPIGLVTITQTPIPASPAASYDASGFLVNLGPATSMGRIAYTVDTTGHVLRTQNLLPTAGPVNPIINDVVNLKAQYGVDANCDGVLTWVPPTGTWSAANVQALPLPAVGPSCVAGVPSLRQIHAVRISIVTRSAQYEKDEVTPEFPPGMTAARLGMFCEPVPACAVSMTLTADDLHYRYKILETAVPLRNALWNTQ